MHSIGAAQHNETAANAAIKTVSTIIGASLFIALLAQISLRLPFTPVPVTLQTLGVYLVAAALGPRKGFLAILTYLAEGFSGLPVFAQGTLPGLAALAGPTGGYLLGFLPAVALSGQLLKKLPATTLYSAAAFACGAIALYACGVLRLAGLLPSGMLLAAGVAPFLAGELFKIALAVALKDSARKLSGKLSL